MSSILDGMTPLEAWTFGYLSGWDRAVDPVNLEWFDWTEQIKEAFRRSESAGRRKAWNDAVLRGENPTPFEREEPS